MKIVKPDWYGIDHTKVTNTFEGNPTFLNYFCVNGEYNPSAVYYCAKPNKRKGHKNFVLLTMQGENLYIRGMNKREMNKFRYQGAMHCLNCDEVIYSVMRHDYRSCTCGQVSVDGGKDYFRYSFQAGAAFDQITLDLLTDTVSDTK